MSFCQRYSVRVGAEAVDGYFKELANILKELQETSNKLGDMGITINGKNASISDVADAAGYCELSFLYMHSKAETIRKLEAIYSKINGSDTAWAVLMSDSDYGVSIEHYGNVSAVEIPLQQSHTKDWVSSDGFTIEIKLPEEQWCRYLHCQPDEIEGRLEDSENIVKVLLEQELSNAPLEKEQAGTGFYDEMNLEEFSEDDLTASYSVPISGSGTVEDFANRKAQFEAVAKKIKSVGGSILVALDGAEGQDTYRNLLVSFDEPCYIEFETGPNYFGDVHAFRFNPTVSTKTL